MTRKSVQGGHCTYPDDENCALEKQGCNDSTNFLSSREMQNGPGMAHGGSCRWQDSVKGTKLGKCDDISNGNSEGDDYYHCSPNAESCQSESDSTTPDIFTSNNDYDKNNINNNNCVVGDTFFGRCNSDLRCAWSPEDCDDNDGTIDDNRSNSDFWTFPVFDCTCDNVQVGACSTKDATDLAATATEDIFCAVSSDGCDDMQTWIRPTEVMGVAGFDCYLCREESTTTTITTTATAPPAISTTTAPPAISTTDTDTTDNTSSSSSSNSNSNSNNMNDNDNNDNNSGLIVGVVLGAVAILSIVGFVGWKLVHSSRNRSFLTAKERSFHEPPPTTAVELSSESYGSGNDEHAHQHRRTKIDLADNVSVLSDEE